MRTSKTQAGDRPATCRNRETKVYLALTITIHTIPHPKLSMTTYPVVMSTQVWCLLSALESSICIQLMSNGIHPLVLWTLKPTPSTTTSPNPSTCKTRSLYPKITPTQIIYFKSLNSSGHSLHLTNLIQTTYQVHMVLNLRLTLPQDTPAKNA